MAYFNQDNRGGGGNRFGGGNNRGGGNRFGGGGRDGMRPTMHKAVCDECGNSCEVPFRPTGDKPIYCSNCFESKREGSGGNRRDDRNFNRTSFRDKQMFTATCDKCGESCEVPFKPSGDKPVFCSNCFERKDSNTGSSSNNADLKSEFASINSKLDKLIKALTPEAVKSTAPEKKVVKAKKVEKAVKAEPKKVAKKPVVKAVKKVVKKKAVAKKK